jgi:hypothetical protein
VRKAILMKAAALAAGAALLLAGCGDSHPIAEPAAGNATPGRAYAAPSGEFAPVKAGGLPKAAMASGKCNLDTINGMAPDSKPLSHGQPALFAGWAASNDGKNVPQTIAIVLRGQKDFLVQTPTGAPRPDVVSANGEPGLANSGYMVEVDLSAVPSGSYTVELHYSAGGKAWRCESTHAVTVE